MKKLIEKDTQYIIYGAGESGEKYAQNLLSNGYIVLGYLDRDKEGVSKYTGLPIQQLGKEKYNKNSVVVLISLANGNLHYNVAKILFLQGYTHVIFLPMSTSMPYGVRNQLTELYNEVIQGTPAMSFPLESIENYLELSYSDKDCVIQEMNGKKKVWVNQEIIFAESFDDYKGDKSRLPKVKKIYDNHISVRTGYFNLFAYLSGENADVAEYAEGYFGVTSKDKCQAMLREREQLYKTFQREFTKGNMQFFIDGAPEATWNNSGYFNLVGGHHRTVFLLHKRLRYCPLVITNHDYEMWKNSIQFDELNKELLRAEDLQVNSPIPHPFFFNIFSAQSDEMEDLLFPVMFFLLEEMSYGSALDISEWDGYFARLAYRAKIPQISCFVNKKDIEKVELINKMLYVENVTVECRDIQEIQKRYDVVFAINSTMTTDRIQKIDEITQKVLFCELASMEEIEWILKSTNFSQYKMLHKACKNGKQIQVGVFLK